MLTPEQIKRMDAATGWDNNPPVPDTTHPNAINRLQELQASRQQSQPKKSSIGEKILSFTGGDTHARNIGQGIAQFRNAKLSDESLNKTIELQTSLLQHIKDKKQKGEDTTRLEAALADVGGQLNHQAAGTEDLINPEHITTKELVGDTLQVASTLGGGALLGKIGGGAKAATTIGKGILQGAKTGAIGGVIEGGAQGLAQGLKENEDASGVAKSGITGAILGGVGGGIVGGVVGGVGGAISKAKNASQPFASPEEAFDSIKPKLTQKEIAEKARNGLIDFDSAGNYIEKPSKEEMRLADVSKSLFNPKQNTAQKIGAVNKTIGEVSENEVLPILQNSQVNGGLDDIYNYIDQIQPTKQFGKKLNPTAYQAFKVVREDAKTAISKALKEEFAKDPNVNFNEALWRSRQKIDDIIESQFGASAFDDPLKNAARESSVKARNAIQSFLTDSVSGRDMEKMTMARNALSELQKKGIDVPDGITEEQYLEKLYESFGGDTNIDTASSKAFAEKMKYLSDLFTVRDNYLAPRLGKEDFSALSRFMKKNPKATAAAKYAATAVGGGLLADQILN